MDRVQSKLLNKHCLRDKSPAPEPNLNTCPMKLIKNNIMLLEWILQSFGWDQTVVVVVVVVQLLIFSGVRVLWSQSGHWLLPRCENPFWQKPMIVKLIASQLICPYSLLLLLASAVQFYLWYLRLVAQ